MSRHFGGPIYAGLKTATRRLLDQLGGVDVAAVCSRVGRTQWSEYGNPNSPDRFVPADVLLDAEATAGTPHVTAALARAQGYELTPVIPRDRGELGEALARLSLEVGELFATATRALADGKLTDQEQQQLLEGLDDVIRVASEARALLRPPSS